MKRTVLVIIAILISFGIAPINRSNAKTESKLVNVIVTLDGDPACQFLPSNYVLTKSPVLDRSLESSMEITESGIENFINSQCKGIIQKVNQTYSLLMKGFSVQVNESDIPQLRKIPGVKSVNISPEFVLCDTLADSPVVTGASSVWKMRDSNGLNVTGKGQVIGVIDTGLDWRHPALGGKFGPKEKVINGIDYSANKGIDVDPISHGTAVAGAAAGNGKYKGTAPDANLIGFKVYPELEGGGGTDVNGNILKAMEQSVSLKCTVVNLSLGSAGGGSGSADVSEPYRNAVKAGVVVCAAAGNNGARSDGIPFQVSSPGTIPQLISCGATDDTKHPIIEIAEPSIEKGNTIPGAPFDNKEEWPAGQYLVEDCGYGAEADFAGVEVNGKIALIKRGPVGKNALMFKDKVLNAKKAGAIGCIIYNHSLSTFSGTMFPPETPADTEFIPAIAITYTQGMRLKNLIRDGLSVSVKPGNAYAMMCDFSSMGPSTDLQFKPEISAPGVGVMSTYYMGKEPDFTNPPYKPFSGTSCATPVISGTCALMRQMHPADPPQVIKSKMMSTANLLFNKKANEYIPLMLQGSGRVDVEKAVLTKQYFNPPSLAMKTQDGEKTVQVKATIFNNSRSIAKATLVYWSVGKNTKCEMPDDITIPANGQASFDVKITCDEDTNDVLEGLIFAKFENWEIHLPLIVATGKTGIRSQISDLRVSKDMLDFKDPKIPTVSFRINFGGFEPNTPGRAVTSNYSAGKIELHDIEGYVGTVLFDDDMQVGWYNFHWDGLDYADRMFAPNGKYVLKAIGLKTVIENDVMTIQNQGDPPSAPISLVNSTLAQKPSISSRTIPRQPRLGENFELRFSTSRFNKATLASFVYIWDKAFMEIESVNHDTAFGRNGDGKNFDIKIDNEAGTMRVMMSVDADLADDISGTAISFRCKPKQDGLCKFMLTEALVSTIDGNIAPKDSYGSFDVIVSYSYYDLNRDGIVNELDCDLLMKMIGVAYPDTRYKEDFDFNVDGRTDLEDMAILSRMIGQELSPP